jgi:hypothetical protein
VTARARRRTPMRQGRNLLRTDHTQMQTGIK